MTVQARFYIAKVTKHAYMVNKAYGAGYAVPVPAGVISMQAVTRGEANAEWASATPNGSIEITVNGPAFPWFEERLGKEVAITFDDRPASELEE